jgi:hypothetical protein
VREKGIAEDEMPFPLLWRRPILNRGVEVEEVCRNRKVVVELKLKTKIWCVVRRLRMLKWKSVGHVNFYLA